MDGGAGANEPVQRRARHVEGDRGFPLLDEARRGPLRRCLGLKPRQDHLGHA